MSSFALFLSAIQHIEDYEPLYRQASINDIEGCIHTIQTLPLSVLNQPLAGYRNFNLLMVTW